MHFQIKKFSELKKKKICTKAQDKKRTFLNFETVVRLILVNPHC